MPWKLLGPCVVKGCAGKAEKHGKCPRHYAEWIRGYEITRGTRQERGYDEKWMRLRAVALKTQPYCGVCHTTEDLTVDHIVPLSNGGTSTIDNCQVLCRVHNSKKSNK